MNYLKWAQRNNNNNNNNEFDLKEPFKAFTTLHITTTVQQKTVDNVVQMKINE